MMFLDMKSFNVLFKNVCFEVFLKPNHLPIVLLQVGLKEVEDILRDVDLNGDGLVDFEGKLTHGCYVEFSASAAFFPSPPSLFLFLCRVRPNDVSLSRPRRAALNVKPCPSHPRTR